MKRLSLIIGFILAFILSGIFMLCFAWMFWLLGADDVTSKWDVFMTSIFDKE